MYIYESEYLYLIWLNILHMRTTPIFSMSYPCGSSNVCHPINITLTRGYYLFEAWGVEGGGTTSTICGTAKGARGGYAAGNIFISSTTNFFIYIGQRGSSYPGPDYSAYNGGGMPYISGGGGGATDVRLVGGDPSLSESYSTRILVAGGGGGSDCDWYGGVGGGVFGGNTTNGGKGGTQTNHGAGYVSGSEWSGGFSNSQDTCGGGGGYYGGGSGVILGVGTGGGGGSGYVSGHSECKPYPGFTFYNTVLLAGDQEMPSPLGYSFNEYEGDGYIQIHFLANIYNTKSFMFLQHYFLFLLVFIQWLVPLDSHISIINLIFKYVQINEYCDWLIVSLNIDISLKNWRYIQINEYFYSLYFDKLIF